MPQDEPLKERLRRIEDESFEERQSSQKKKIPSLSNSVAQSYLEKAESGWTLKGRIKWLEKLVESFPNHPYGKMLLGAAYVELECYTNAIGLLEPLIKDYEDPILFHSLAKAYYHTGHLNKALELAQKAVELSPKQAAFHITLGWIYFKLKDYGKARACATEGKHPLRVVF